MVRASPALYLFLCSLAKALASNFLQVLTMTLRRLAFGFSLCVCACVRAPQGREDGEAPVPISREPRHRVVFESPLVRVLDVQVRPGDTTLFHVHMDRHLGVVIVGTRTWEQALGMAGTLNAADAIGSIFDNSRRTLPYTHRVANTDTVAFHYVVAQMLGPSGLATPVLPADSTMILDRETRDARLYRVALNPGQSSARHVHTQPGLLVQIGPGHLEVEGNAFPSHSPNAGAGAWWWRESGHTHVLRNAGHAPINLIEVDLK